MSTEQDAFLDTTLANPGTDQSQPPETPAPSPDPVVKPEAAPAASPEAGPTPAQTQSHAVSLEAFLRVREEGNAAKKELAEYRRREEERKRQEQEAAAKAKETVPDPLLDVEGYNAYWARKQEEAVEAARSEFRDTLFAERLANSEEKWVEKLGGEESEDWQSLNAWINELPDAHVAHIEQQRDPYGFAWKQFKELRDSQAAKSIAEKLGGKDLDAFEAELRERIRAEMEAEREANAPSQSDRPKPPHGPDGKFVSPPQQKRPPPASLNEVNGAPRPNTAEAIGVGFFEDTFR